MKRIVIQIFLMIVTLTGFGQVNINADCVDAIPLCSTPNFTFNATSGFGNVNDIPAGNNISNPSTNPASSNAGCLLSNELKPQWLIITIGNPGNLEFVFGAGNSANPQAGFYDWAMWPYSPTACSQILNNTLPPIRCNWNGSSSGGTGIASAANIPPGGDPTNFEPPLAVNACQQFIICISNYSGVNTLVSFQSLGTASLSCSPNCNPVYSICHGSSVVVTPVNFNNLTNATYTLLPGPLVNTTGNFTVSPTTTTTYTSFITGTNASSVVQTVSATIVVTVNPRPYLSPNVINGNCTNPSNSANLNITFNPSGSPNYTVNWSPTPASVTPVNSPTAAGLIPGMNNVTVTASNGCTNTASFSVAPIPVPVTFTLVNPNNNYTVTCNNPVVVLTTSAITGAPLTYTWFPGCSSTLTGSSYNFTQSCTGQVVATNSTGCSFTQTFSIFQNYSTPTIVITPTVQNITCASASGCFTAICGPGPNVTSNWFQVSGSNTVYVGTPQGTLNLFCPTAPGVYYFEAKDNITGCVITRSVDVTASVGVPQFTVTSPTNFTVGCASTSLTSMQVSSVITSPVLNTPVSYTFLPPGSTAVITPTSTLSNNPNMNNISLPGMWVVYVKDLTNNCLVSQSISIIQNTIAPNINFIQSISMIKCKDPFMVLNGVSSNQNTTITWTVPAIPSPSVFPASTTTVNLNPSVAGSTANITSVGIFTVGAVDQNNQCRSTKTVQVLQDLRLPVFTISALSNSVITCKDPNVLIVPIVTPTLAGALVPTYTWYPPSGNSQEGTSYNTTVAGSHTAISISTINGCTTNATYNVGIDLNPPALNATSDFTLDCSNNPTVAITPSITGSTSGFTYSWTVPYGAITSNLTSSLLISNSIGVYRVLVTNTVNGCKNISIHNVVPGQLNADFIPSVVQGFAPLTVTFNNTSSTSTGASSIQCLWSFGNGVVTPSNVLNTSNQSATYTSAGTYSVVLFATKGSCKDSAMKLIVVDLPSKLEVPNVFTPNGDKVNDIFRLRSSNLKEIEAKIFDRWGNMVYNVISETGNISWDGKNLQGKECADGTYFYIIKGIGKDDADYDLKGNVTLIR